MTVDKGIFIRNVYYMLAYAFHTLKQNNYDYIANENFEYIHDLFAEILYQGMSTQLKQGLYREYVTQHETLPLMRGKLDINGTIRNRIQKKQLLDCEYDDLSANNRLNQILKTTADILIREKSVDKARRSKLKSLMPFFDGIDTIPPKSIKWKDLTYQRNNRSYRMLMTICYFILDDMLLTTENGEYRMMTFSDDKMNKLFERFILQYYRTEYHGKIGTNASKIDWNIDDIESSKGLEFLPSMQSDVMLSYGEQTFIIDAKYYSHTTQVLFDKHSVHNHNLYQLLTYVNNADVTNSGNVSGMLLYAKTEDEISPDVETSMNGHKIMVKTLDLNQPFEQIREQLDGYVKLVFEL